MPALLPLQRENQLVMITLLRLELILNGHHRLHYLTVAWEVSSAQIYLVRLHNNRTKPVQNPQARQGQIA